MSYQIFESSYNLSQCTAPRVSFREEENVCFRYSDVIMDAMASQITNFTIVKGAVTCAVCPKSAWLVTFLIGNFSTRVVTCSALRCGAPDESGKNGATAPMSKLPQRPLWLKCDSPNSRYVIMCYTIGFLGNDAVGAMPCDHHTLCVEICPQAHATHVIVA